MRLSENFSRKEIEAYEKGYQIDKDGIVTYKGKTVKGYINKKGYKEFGYSNKNGKKQKVTFHRFQGYQKFGNKIYEENMLIRHLDGDSLNNSWNNIGIGNDHDNMMDQTPEVRKRKAIHATQGIIRWDYKKIRAMHDAGMSYSQIMKETGITSKGTLSYIINKRYINREDLM